MSGLEMHPAQGLLREEAGFSLILFIREVFDEH